MWTFFKLCVNLEVNKCAMVSKASYINLTMLAKILSLDWFYVMQAS